MGTCQLSGNFTEYSVGVNMCRTPRPFMLSYLTREDFTFIPHFTGDICMEASVIVLWKYWHAITAGQV